MLLKLLFYFSSCLFTIKAILNGDTVSVSILLISLYVFSKIIRYVVNRKHCCNYQKQTVLSLNLNKKEE